MTKNNQFTPIEWRSDCIRLLDQRVLPQSETYIDLRGAGEVAKAIKDMVVRGAPAIGITAAYAVVLAAIQDSAQESVLKGIVTLADSRPTAVNLHWALERMRGLVVSGADVDALLTEAQRIHREDIEANLHMAELGAAFLDKNAMVITHCNTGALATGGHGTALGVIRTAHTQGKLGKVYAGETRPWLQGARLTAWELRREEIPVTLLCDSAMASLMSQGKIDWVIVGADRIVANGDVANKIGTYSLAVTARYHGVKFMVVAPSSTVDMSVKQGVDIPIECRAPEEITDLAGRNEIGGTLSAWNPVFDITPAELIDVIVTERGAIESPGTENMRRLFAG